MATVGVVIPAYNATPFLEETVRSVQAQTHADWEAVVVDDGSTDETAPLAARLAAHEPRLRLERVVHGGVSTARNRGLAALSDRCRRVIFLDSDDTWEPDTLAVLSGLLDALPGAVGANGVACSTDAHGCLLREGPLEEVQRSRLAITERGPAPWPSDRPTEFPVLAWYPCVLNGTIMYRREALSRAGVFDPSLRYFEDWDLLLRLALEGPIAFLDRRVLRYRRHHGGNASCSAALYTGLRRVRRKAMQRLRHDPVRSRLLLLAQRYAQDRNASEQMGLVAPALREGHLRGALAHLTRGTLGTARRVFLDARLRFGSRCLA